MIAIPRAISTRHLHALMWLSCVGFFLCVLLGHSTWAATSMPVGGETADFTLFDSLETDAKTQSTGWFNTILALVRPTFLLLGTIEICWAAALWAFEKDNLSSLAVEIIKKIMFIGFFYALLQYAPEWIPSITNTFQDVGQQATGSAPVTTDGVIAQGLAIIKFIWSYAPSGVFEILGKLGQILIACFVTLGVVIAFVVLAAQYFTLKIESYILFAAGAIFLGMGSSSWTKEYVSKYLNYAINVGVRLLVLILILSLMLNSINQMADSFEFEYVPLLKLLAVSVLQAILGIKAPEMAGALLSGGVGLSAGSAKGAGASMMSSVSTAAGVAAAAVGKSASAAQGMSNIGKAASAGRDLSKQEGKTGAAAMLGGLGKAAAQAAKELPSSLVRAAKGGRGVEHNPGLFDRTKQSLQAGHTGDAKATDRGGNSARSAAGAGARQPVGGPAKSSAASDVSGSRDGTASASQAAQGVANIQADSKAGIQEFYAPKAGDKAKASGATEVGKHSDSQAAEFYAPKAGSTADHEEDPPPPYSPAASTAPATPDNGPADANSTTKPKDTDRRASLRKGTPSTDSRPPESRNDT